MCDLKRCVFSCLLYRMGMGGATNTGEGEGELSDCLRCDEKLCGPVKASKRSPCSILTMSLPSTLSIVCMFTTPTLTMPTPLLPLLWLHRGCKYYGYTYYGGPYQAFIGCAGANRRRAGVVSDP